MNWTVVLAIVTEPASVAVVLGRRSGLIVGSAVGAGLASHQKGLFPFVAAAVAAAVVVARQRGRSTVVVVVAAVATGRMCYCQTARQSGPPAFRIDSS